MLTCNAVARLQRIRDFILAHPHHFNMNSWWYRKQDFRGNTCGTTACIAGWALIGEKPNYSLSEEEIIEANNFGASNRPIVECRAGDLLGLDLTQRKRLFYRPHWPVAFKGGITNEEQAELAAARINHFIATEGAE